MQTKVISNLFSIARKTKQKLKSVGIPNSWFVT